MSLSICISDDEVKTILQKNTAGLDSDSNLLRAVVTFNLLWPIYEKKCCGKRASFRALEEFSEGRSADELETEFQYFKKRYTCAGRLEQLISSGKDDRVNDAIKEMQNSPDPETKLLALLCVVYRLRNNHFHGEKVALDYWGQRDVFRNANKVLVWAIKQSKS